MVCVPMVCRLTSTLATRAERAPSKATTAGSAIGRVRQPTTLSRLRTANGPRSAWRSFLNAGRPERSGLQFRQMRVRFWGTRGSVPTPGPSTVRYGGNTACVELRTTSGAFFIFDSGTGIRELGLELARQGGGVSAHLMLGHTHWDHIHGFPFFTPAFV